MDSICTINLTWENIRYQYTPIIDLGKDYRYLRFTVKKTHENRSGGFEHPFFCLGELQVYGMSLDTEHSQYYYMDGMKDAVDNMIGEFRYNVESQGMSFDRYVQAIGMTEDSIKSMYRPRAEKDVKLELALQKIAELEGIEATEEEISAQYDKLAAAVREGLDMELVYRILGLR